MVLFGGMVHGIEADQSELKWMFRDGVMKF